MNLSRWVILIFLSAAISAALFTALGSLFIPGPDIEGYDLQAFARTYALAIVVLAFFFLMFAVPITVFLRRVGRRTWLNLVAAGALAGAIAGLLAYVPDHGSGPMPLYTWWRFSGWGAVIGAVSAAIWAYFESKFRRV